MRTLRLLIAEKLLAWALAIMPESQEKVLYGRLLSEYLPVVLRGIKG